VVYRVALRILGRQADAEDVTQEAFVMAYRSMPSYRGDGSPRAWLLRIAQRIAFRRLSQRRATAGLDAIPEPRIADASEEPARVLVADEDRSAVRRAVVQLPEPYREVVALRF